MLVRSVTGRAVRVGSYRRGWRVTVDLSAREVRAFAEMYPDPLVAGRVLVSVGWPRGRLPLLGLNAEEYWWEVSRLLGAGIVRGGRRRLLAAAREEFPAHRLFTGPAEAEEHPEPAVWNVPPRLPWFVGREGQLSELEAKLVAGSVVSVVALAGMGGVGKTALAVEYAWQYGEAFDVVRWVPAEQADQVPGHLAALGEALDLPVGAEPAAVLAELRRRGRPWLLVFDNAEELAAVAPFRPVDRHGRVLVTSRRAGWGVLGETVQVPTLSRSESVAMLIGRLPETASAVADRVADLLGDLAMAVEQAAAFCDRTGTPLADLADPLADRLDDVIGLGEVADRAGVTVETLWDLSIRRLAATSPAAVELLELLALCAPEPVPLDLFDGRAGLLGATSGGVVYGE